MVTRSLNPSAPAPSPNPADLADLAARVRRLEQDAPADKLCLCVFSGELDRQLAALIMATGAAASGMEVSIFYTFWATSALRAPNKQPRKGLMGRMFGWLLPRGSRKLKLSQLQMLGAGPALIRRIMRKRGMASLEDLMEIAGELSVRIRVCAMSMELLEIQPEELVPYPGLEYCGVATFVEESASARTTLFV